MLIAVLASIAVAGIWLSAVVIARHRAQAAADLAALNAAARMPAGPAEACRQADALSRAMGASVRSCVIEQLDVIVVVSVPVGGRITRDAKASARAGPADTP